MPRRELKIKNLAPEFPIVNERKKNKNDFYRFLLQQNFSTEGSDTNSFLNPKVYNDILIPRSILKKGEA
jgi:hypothetical protein